MREAAIRAGWTDIADQLFRQATALRDQERYAEAREACIGALRALPQQASMAHGAVYRETGLTHDLEGDTAEAVHWFARARDLRPTCELTSVALFHALYGLGRLDEALEEAGRFCLIRESPRYGELFELGLADVSPELQAKHDHVRQLARSPRSG